MREPRLRLGPDLVQLVAEIDEFKGRWESYKTVAPDRLTALRRVATIESIGSSTRIEGSKLTDTQVEAASGDLRRHGRARATWYSLGQPSRPA